MISLLNIVSSAREFGSTWVDVAVINCEIKTNPAHYGWH